MKSITQNNENDNKVSSSIIKFFKTYQGDILWKYFLGW